MKLAGRLFLVSLFLLQAYPHSFIDWCGATLPAQPEREFNYFVYSAWLAAASFIAAFTRTPRPWIAPLAIIAAGAAVATFGVVTSYGNGVEWTIFYLPWGVGAWAAGWIIQPKAR